MVCYEQGVGVKGKNNLPADGQIPPTCFHGIALMRASQESSLDLLTCPLSEIDCIMRHYAMTNPCKLSIENQTRMGRSFIIIIQVYCFENTKFFQKYIEDSNYSYENNQQLSYDCKQGYN